MADYYIDTDGSGTSPYDTWAKAANTNTLAQTVLDTAVAGETIHARGTLTLTATLDIDTNQGNITDGFIKLIGYNASGVNDGTRFIIDGNDAVTDVIFNNSMDYWFFENIEAKNGTGDGFTGGGFYYNFFNNCCANNNGAYGFDTYACYYTIWFRCISYSNTSHGFGPGRVDHKYLFCRSKDNGGSGFELMYASGCLVVGCIADHNGGSGFRGLYAMATLINCVTDGNTNDGILSRDIVNNGASLVLGCRVTNHSGPGDVGLDAKTNIFLHGWNYFQDNDGNNIQNDTLVYEILHNGANTDVEDQSDTECGYTDQDDPEDYNLTDEATSRRTSIEIPES